MSEVTYSRPWLNYGLLYMMASIPTVVLVLALNAKFPLVPEPAPTILAVALWMSPAWAFVPIIVGLSSRISIERGRKAIYSERQRQGRLAVYDYMLVVRLWEYAGVRTEVVGLDEIESVEAPGETLPMVCYSVKIVLFDGRKRRKVVWYTSTPHRLADAVHQAKAKLARSTSPDDSVNPVRRTAASGG